MTPSPPILAPTSPVADGHEFDLLCPSCGYDLRGTTGDRCTECGLEIDRATLAVSALPWSHRKRIGYGRAYLRTVWMVFRRPTLVGREAAKPQSWADAKGFRGVTTLVLFLALLATAAIVVSYALYEGVEFEWPGTDANPMSFGAWPPRPATFWTDFTIVALAGWELWYFGPLYLLALCSLWTGLAGYFFHPRSLSVERQNRAVALSCYTAAPLVGLWPVLLLGLVGAGLAVVAGKSSADYEWAAAAQVVAFAAGALLVVVLGSWWMGTLKVLRAATQASVARVAFAAMALPVLWVASVALCLYVVPSVVGFFTLVVTSVRYGA